MSTPALFKELCGKLSLVLKCVTENRTPPADCVRQCKPLFKGIVGKLTCSKDELFFIISGTLSFCVPVFRWLLTSTDTLEQPVVLSSYMLKLLRWIYTVSVSAHETEEAKALRTKLTTALFETQYIDLTTRQTRRCTDIPHMYLFFSLCAVKKTPKRKSFDSLLVVLQEMLRHSGTNLVAQSLISLCQHSSGQVWREWWQSFFNPCCLCRADRGRALWTDGRLGKHRDHTRVRCDALILEVLRVGLRHTVDVEGLFKRMYSILLITHHFSHRR